MNPRDETLDSWNKVAKIYDGKFSEMHLYDHTYKEFVDVLSLGASVLDIGCGPGNISHFLVKRRPDINISGVDHSSQMLDIARKKIPGADFYELDCVDILSIEDRFQGIICGFLLPYLTKIEVVQFIGDCAQLLKAGGVLYLSFVPSDENYSEFMSNSEGLRMLFHYYREKFIEDILKENNLSVLSSFAILYGQDQGGQEHKVIIVKKI